MYVCTYSTVCMGCSTVHTYVRMLAIMGLPLVNVYCTVHTCLPILHTDVRTSRACTVPRAPYVWVLRILRGTALRQLSGNTTSAKTRSAGGAGVAATVPGAAQHHHTLA